MRDFIAEGIRDLSIGLIVGSIIALLIEQKISGGAALIFIAGITLWILAIMIKLKGQGGTE